MYEQQNPIKKYGHTPLTNFTKFVRTLRKNFRKMYNTIYNNLDFKICFF